MKRIIFSLLMSAVLLVAPVAAQDGGLRVDATESLGEINPNVYGINYGPWALVPLDMLEAAANSANTMYRFPAGRHGDTHGFTNQQLDMFMNQMRQWGGVPSISVMLEGGTPERAAEQVRYANIEKGYNITYWSIGNEPDLFSAYDLDRFNTEWRAIAEAMLAVDPNIILMGPEVSQFPYTVEGTEYTNERREWVREFLKVNGDLVDIVTVHRYPFPQTMSSPPRTIEDLRQNSPEWDITIENLRTVIREAVGHDMPMGFTELNSDWTPVREGVATPDSEYHAIWWADVLGRFIRQGVDVVNYFTLASYGETGTYGILDRYKIRPTYYVYQMYRHLGDELLASESSDFDVTITAALRDDGALTLMVINRGPDAKALPLSLTGFEPQGEAEVWRLDAEHHAVLVDPVEVADGTVLALPAQSAMLYVLHD